MKKPCEELKKFEQFVYCCPINLYIFWPVVCHILWSIEHTLIDGYKIRLHTNFKVTIYPKLAMIISYHTIDSSHNPGTRSCTSDEDLELYLHTVYIFPYICIGNRWCFIFNDTYQIWTEVFFHLVRQLNTFKNMSISDFIRVSNLHSEW